MNNEAGSGGLQNGDMKPTGALSAGRKREKSIVRLFLMIPILAAALHADPITVVETNTGNGLVSLFNSYSVPETPGPVTAQINGYAQCFSCVNPVTGTIDLTMDLYTGGPVRNGIAYVQLSLLQGGGVIPDISGAIGPYALGGCASELDCELFGYFPFQLGTSFTIDLSGVASGTPSNNAAQFFASASVQLYELPTDGGPAGAPVQIYATPEPGSAELAFTGLGLIVFAIRRKRNLASA